MEILATSDGIDEPYLEVAWKAPKLAHFFPEKSGMG